MKKFTFLIGLAILISASTFASDDSGDSRLLFASLAEKATGISGISLMVADSRTLEVGDQCRWTHYRFFLSWDGDRRTARQDDQLIEVLCYQENGDTEWSCSVNEIVREKLRVPTGV